MGVDDPERRRKDLEQDEPYWEKRGWPPNEPCSGCGLTSGHTPDCPNR
jgi:hypothetical protein